MTEHRIREWLRTGNVGASSRAMAHLFLGITGERHHPHDTHDFERCLGLLRAAPELRDRLHELAALSEYWRALVPRWDALEAAPSATRSAMIREICAPLEAADPHVFRLGPGVTVRFGSAVTRGSAG